MVAKSWKYWESTAIGRTVLLYMRCRVWSERVPITIGHIPLDSFGKMK
jgi:hypothetical protein